MAILGFKQYFDKGKTERTWFREKILNGTSKQELWTLSLDPKLTIGKKIHTIRLDLHNRWKPGMSIQMAYGVRTSNYQQFNKGIPELETCVSVQNVAIRWVPLGGNIVPPPVKELRIFIDNKRLVGEQLQTFAENDGFLNIHEFGKWFNKDFTGCLIHWTPFRY